MLVRMFMSPDPMAVTPEASLTAAAELMRRRSIRRLLVVTGARGAEHLVGILSATDLFRALPATVNPFSPAGVPATLSLPPVAQVMTRRPLVAEPNMSIEQAAELMRRRKVGALPVVRGQRPVGIITESDIFGALVNVLSGDGVRVLLDLSDCEDGVERIAAAARHHALRLASVLTFTWNQKLRAVVRVAGADRREFVEELWQSGLPVLSVTE